MPFPIRNPLRSLAEAQIDDSFGPLDERTRLDLVTSVVRQWITYEGHAVIHTRDHTLHYHLLDEDRWQPEVVREIEEGMVFEHLRHNRVDVDVIPALLHQLNLRQSVRCLARDGRVVCLRVDPAQRTTHIELERSAG